MNIKEIASRSGLVHDNDEDTRLFKEDMIDVHAQIMTKEQYTNMEKEMNEASIKGEGYSIYAWNDVSGYNYWKNSGDDSNYIQITADIEDASLVDPIKLKRDMEIMNDKLSGWGNSEEYHNYLYDKKNK